MKLRGLIAAGRVVLIAVRGVFPPYGRSPGISRQRRHAWHVSILDQDTRRILFWSTHFRVVALE